MLKQLVGLKRPVVRDEDMSQVEWNTDNGRVRHRVGEESRLREEQFDASRHANALKLERNLKFTYSRV